MPTETTDPTPNPVDPTKLRSSMDEPVNPTTPTTTTAATSSSPPPSSTATPTMQTPSPKSTTSTPPIKGPRNLPPLRKFAVTMNRNTSSNPPSLSRGASMSSSQGEDNYNSSKEDTGSVQGGASPIKPVYGLPAIKLVSQPSAENMQAMNNSLPPSNVYDNQGYEPDFTAAEKKEVILDAKELRKQLGSKAGNDGELGEDEAFVDEMVVIERPIYSQKDFDEGFDGGRRPTKSTKKWAKKKASKCECNPSCVGKSITGRLPFLKIMREYSLRRDLVADLIAGLTVGIMHIPQGMAYGQLSTLPPVYGLYVSFFPVILYFFLGTSKHISMGTFAVVSLMVGSAVDKGLKDINFVPTPLAPNVTSSLLEGEDTEEMVQTKLKLAMGVTFAVGAFQLLLGFLRLGFLTVYLSDPLISGFTTGAACHVFTSQVKHVFGISMNRYSGAFKLVYSYRDIFVNLPDTNIVTFIASMLCLVLLYVVKEYINNNPKVKPHLKMPVPIELIVVALGTVLSYFIDLEKKYGVKIVGDVPIGIPEPNLNAFTYLSDMISSCFAIAIVSFAISVSMAKIFAKKHEYFIDANQELLAYGVCNVASSFFSSFVSSASLSRSLIQENAGGRTQITGLVSSALLLVVLLVIGPYFKTLPNCILASIILVALKGMFKQFLELKRLWGISTIDFAVWLLTFTATVLLDVDYGLLIGVVFALLTVIIRSQRPYSCLLGQVPGTDIYKDINVYKAAIEADYIKIFRFDSALFFANSEFFRSSLYKLAVDPNELKKKQKKLDKQKRKDSKKLVTVTVDSNGSGKIMTPDDMVLAEETQAATTTTNNKPTGSSQVDKNSPATSQVTSPVDPQIKLPTLTNIHYVIVDCSTMSYIDSVGVKVLQQIVTELKTYNVTIYLAQCKSGVRDMFEKTGFNQDILFVTIHDAVVSAQLHRWSITGENNPLSNGAANNNNSSLTDDEDSEDGEADDVREEKDENSKPENGQAPASNGGGPYTNGHAVTEVYNTTM